MVEIIAELTEMFDWSTWETTTKEVEDVDHRPEMVLRTRRVLLWLVENTEPANCGHGSVFVNKLHGDTSWKEERNITDLLYSSWICSE